MALALLDLVDTQDDGGYRFAVDTGTNTEFEIRIGGGVVRRAGADFVEPVSFATPRRRTDGSPMGSATEVGVRPPPGRDAKFAQLFSWKGDRRAATFSDIVVLPRPLPPRRRTVARPYSLETRPMSAMAAPAVRTLARRDLAQPTAISFDTILDAVLKIAQPMMVANLAVKTIHDKYNSEGIAVTNGLGESWTLTGDGHLTPISLAKMQAAVEQSAEDIIDPAVQQPGFNPDAFCARVWKHVPQLTAKSADDVRATLIAWLKPDSPALTSAAAKVIYDQADFLIKELKARNKLRDAT